MPTFMPLQGGPQGKIGPLGGERGGGCNRIGCPMQRGRLRLWISRRIRNHFINDFREWTLNQVYSLCKTISWHSPLNQLSGNMIRLCMYCGSIQRFPILWPEFHSIVSYFSPYFKLLVLWVSLQYCGKAPCYENPREPFIIQHGVRS